MRDAFDHRGRTEHGGLAFVLVMMLAPSIAGCFLDRSGIVAGADGGCGTQELCDGIDNDCDPSTPDGSDEPTLGTACDSDGDADACDDDAFACQGGVLTCVDDGVDIPEVCGGGDEDCDGLTDEVGTSWYLDGDGDGYGAGVPMLACIQPAMHVAMDGDCDDANAAVNPIATEICDGTDQNCNGEPDDAVCGCPSIAIAGRAYLLCNPTHWSDAEARCRGVGYVLADVEESSEATALGTALSGGDWWLALHYSASAWRWSDGSPITTDLWGAGEGTSTPQESCGALRMTGEWADRACGDPLPFICER